MPQQGTIIQLIVILALDLQADTFGTVTMPWARKNASVHPSKTSVPTSYYPYGRNVLMCEAIQQVGLFISAILAKYWPQSIKGGNYNSKCNQNAYECDTNSVCVLHNCLVPARRWMSSYHGCHSIHGHILCIISSIRRPFYFASNFVDRRLNIAVNCRAVVVPMYSIAYSQDVKI